MDKEEINDRRNTVTVNKLVQFAHELADQSQWTKEWIVSSWTSASLSSKSSSHILGENLCRSVADESRDWVWMAVELINDALHWVFPDTNTDWRINPQLNNLSHHFKWIWKLMISDSKKTTIYRQEQTKIQRIK
jgi:hypothetical protein